MLAFGGVGDRGSMVIGDRSGECSARIACVMDGGGGGCCS